MAARRTVKTTIGTLWRAGLCAGMYVVGAAGGGALVSALGMPLPEVPAQADERIMSLLLVVASFALAAGLIPLARRLQGPYWLRWLMLATLCYACLGVASPLEGAIFTNLRGMGSIPVLFLPPCLLLAAVMAALFRPVRRDGAPTEAIRRFFRGGTCGQWTRRFAAAVLAFPVVYWTFGLMVAPFVMEYYQQGQFALAVPSPGVIVATQFLRSLLFLVASVPILVMWSGSKRQLVLALGLAFYLLVGLFGMIQSYWLAPTLQILHNTEIFLDSMIYALALVLLLVRRDPAESGIVPVLRKRERASDPLMKRRNGNQLEVLNYDNVQSPDGGHADDDVRVDLLRGRRGATCG